MELLEISIHCLNQYLYSTLPDPSKIPSTAVHLHNYIENWYQKESKPSDIPAAIPCGSVTVTLQIGAACCHSRPVGSHKGPIRLSLRALSGALFTVSCQSSRTYGSA